MQAQPVFHMPAPTETADALQAGRSLGELLSQMPEYRAFLEALKQVNNDLTVQKISAPMRAYQSAIQWGRDVVQNAAELERLEQELKAMPLVQTYRQAEAAVRQLLLAADEIIGREAGVDFAANAKRSCCG